MYLNLLSDSLSWGDRLNYMGVGVLLGVVVVFAVLALLWLILELFGAVARRGQTAAEKPVAPAPETVAPPTPTPDVAPVMSDEEIVAAITAALAVYLEESGSAAPSVNGFRVVSFKKVGNAAHWNQN